MRVEDIREVLGTTVKVVVDGVNSKEALEIAFSECERIEKAFSRFLGGNELARLNGALGEWMEVSEELFFLIEWGERLRQETAGAFDITVKSILDSWGYDKNYSLEEGGVGSLGRVELDSGKQAVRIGAEIDLGGIGKGYALDRLSELLSEFENVCVDAGGDIFAKGLAREGRPWRMAFENPQKEGEAIGFVDVGDFCIACSNPSKRKWRDKHHLIDALTGSPANGMLAVYTQSKSGLFADSYATALFVLGYDKAKALLSQIDVEAMLVASDGRVFRSENFKGELFTGF